MTTLLVILTVIAPPTLLLLAAAIFSELRRLKYFLGLSLVAVLIETIMLTLLFSSPESRQSWASDVMTIIVLPWLFAASIYTLLHRRSEGGALFGFIVAYFAFLVLVPTFAAGFGILESNQTKGLFTAAP